MRAYGRRDRGQATPNGQIVPQRIDGPNLARPGERVKFKIVVSDLHIGAGATESEANPLEDFDQDEAFAELLAHLAGESDHYDSPLELIFAGDTFEFLQVPALGGRRTSTWSARAAAACSSCPCTASTRC
jgi:hypothetical protein